MSFQNNIFYKKVHDFSVTKEIFELHHNPEYDLLITYPKPDLNDLGRYYESEDYISHTDAKRSIFEKAYHLVKKYAIQQKLKLIDQNANKGTLLDIGAGTGDFLVAAKQKGWLITGIEPNENAKTIATLKGIPFADNLEALESSSFDAITLWHVLEHVPDLHYYIQQLKRLLKPNGIIVIAVPNFKSYDAQFYGKFWAAFDVPRHLWHFSKTAIHKLFLEAQLNLVHIKPMKFDSYYVSLLSEKYKTGTMNPFSAFWIGWQSNRKGNHTKEYSSHIYILKHL